MPSCTPSPGTPPVTVAQFKAAYGVRNFKFGEGSDTVMDGDVSDAVTDALQVYNPCLFGFTVAAGQAFSEGQVAFMYLVAHFVRTNVQAAGGLSAKPEGLGIENQSEQVLASAGAGGVNQGFVQPPDRVKGSPLLLPLWNTTYGQKYCMMAVAKTTGAFSAISGPVDPGTVAVPNVPFTVF